MFLGKNIAVPICQVRNNYLGLFKTDERKNEPQTNK